MLPSGFRTNLPLLGELLYQRSRTRVFVDSQCVLSTFSSSDRAADEINKTVQFWRELVADTNAELTFLLSQDLAHTFARDVLDKYGIPYSMFVVLPFIAFQWFLIERNSNDAAESDVLVHSGVQHDHDPANRVLSCSISNGNWMSILRLMTFQ